MQTDLQQRAFFGNTKVLWHDVNTNGIAYLTLYFDLSVVRKRGSCLMSDF